MNENFYQQYGDVGVDESIQLTNEAKSLGAELTEKQLSFNELIAFIDDKKSPVVLLDWNIVKGKPGYQGHFVPMVGYTDSSVIVHNQGMNDPAPFLEIPKEKFETARKAKGTDEDTLIISSP